MALPDKADVLIVGAGPVGLFLGNECARRNMSFRIIEAHAGQSDHSKALAIFPRTLEIFDMAGVAQPFLDVANRVTSVAVFSGGKPLASMTFAPKDSPYPFIAMVPQDVTERLLVEELSRKGGHVEYETEFVSARPTSSGVQAAIRRRGEAATVHATFVVGCDGAHSKVREAISAPMEGGDYPDTFMLADIETNDVLPADQLQLCPNPSGPAALFPISATRRRLVATVHGPDGGEPSLDMARQILAERCPPGIEARSLYWSSYFHIHHRRAARLRAGPIFIAGDAAHIHSPFGGQGMNTGLHDVWNLVWKLDLCLRGLGGEPLLDSYESERAPVIAGVIRTTDFLTRVMGTPNRFVALLRNAIIPVVSGLAPFQHAFVRRLSELGVGYRGSPLVEGRGERFLTETMRGGMGVCSKFLLLAGAESAPAVQAWRGPSDELVETRPSDTKGVKLVRPDGYIALASDLFDEKARRAIAALLAKHARQPFAARLAG